MAKGRTKYTLQIRSKAAEKDYKIYSLYDHGCYEPLHKGTAQGRVLVSRASIRVRAKPESIRII